MKYEGVCPNCDADMDVIGSGQFKGKGWTNWRCPECGYIDTNEPDWDEIRDSKKEIA